MDLGCKTQRLHHECIGPVATLIAMGQNFADAFLMGATQDRHAVSGLIALR